MTAKPASPPAHASVSAEAPAFPLHVPVARLPELAGRDLGRSPWVTLNQDRIDRFAEATEDYQWIHIDPVRASAQGGTIAHGFLTLALLPGLSGMLLTVDGASHVLNCGINRLRFTAPVRSGSRLRLHQRVIDVTARAGGWQMTSDCQFELEGSERPACIVETIMLALPGPAEA